MDTLNPIYSRRLFLRRGVQLLSVAGTIPLFLDRSGRAMAAEFAANPQGAGRPDRVLVIVQLAGGNDGLNTLVPIRNDDYYKARPRLAIGKDTALKINDDFGFHPSMSGFKKMWDDGRMGVIHAVGYPNPNRSHFRATDIWSTAEPEKVARDGWLGRYFDACCSGSDPGPAAKKDPKAPATANPNNAVALTAEPPQTLVGPKFLPIAFRSPESLAYSQAKRDGRIGSAFNKLNDLDPDANGDMMDDEDFQQMSRLKDKKIKLPMGTQGSVSPAADETDEFLQRTALNARLYAEEIKKTAANVKNKVTYPGGGNRFAADLKLVAQMIASGLPTRVYYVSLGGFDTHSNQATRHTRLMEQLSSGLTAFTDDLKALGQFDRTTVLTFSEFGRRVAENGSQGTDHGEAAPMFLMGGAIKPGFYGKAPELSPAKLNRGDVRWSTDFRRVYATMLREWLKADDAKVLGGKFESLGVFKSA